MDKNEFSALVFCEYCQQFGQDPVKTNDVYLKIGKDLIAKNFDIDALMVSRETYNLAEFERGFAKITIEHACSLLADELLFLKNEYSLCRCDFDPIIKKLVKTRLYTTKRFKVAAKSARYRERKSQCQK